MTAVYLEWYDHATKVGWVSEAEVSDPDHVYPILNYTMGWIVHETKDQLIVSHTINEDSCCDPLVILKACITRRKNFAYKAKGRKKT